MNATTIHSFSEERPLHSKKSIIHILDEDAKVYDIKGILSMDAPEVGNIFSLLRSTMSVVFGWLKGENITFFTSDTLTSRWDDLLTAMHIGIAQDPKGLSKLAKRLARAFSPRDAVAKITSEALNLLVVDDLEMSRSNHAKFMPEQHKMLLDGTGIIKLSFALRHGKAFGITTRKLTRAEALSVSIIAPEGMLKGLFYIVKDDAWAWGDHNVVCSAENVKSELFTTDGETVWMAYDVFRHYSTPKSNADIDFAVGRMIYSVDHRTTKNSLSSYLLRDFESIRSGNAVKHLTNWTLPQLDSDAVYTENEDFATLAVILHDFAVRGGDYRNSPTLVSMLRTATDRQYWNSSKNWPKYPLLCTLARPVICESAAALLGEGIKVENGTIRAIREGDVWVVSDEDWMGFFAYNSGGADQDDHWFLIFREVDGVKKVLCVRIPAGWAEFNVMNFVEGDPFPEFVDAFGKSWSFPPMAGPVTPALNELEANGHMKFNKLPDADILSLPTTYSVDHMELVVTDIMMNPSGFLGQVINAVFMAMAEYPHLLRHQEALLETIIDTFTQGGAGVSRAHLSQWAKDLVKSVAAAGPVDQAIWTRRAGNPKNVAVNLVQGYWSEFVQNNKDIRTSFKTQIVNWHTQYMAVNLDFASKLAGVFGVNPMSVQSTQHPVLLIAHLIHNSYNSERHILNMQAEGRSLTSDEWKMLYQNVADSIIAAGGGDEAFTDLLSLAVWLVSLTSQNPDDKLVMNSVSYTNLMKAAVHYGVLADIGSLVNLTSWDREMDISSTPADNLDESMVSEWNMTCPHCGKSATTEHVARYVNEWVLSPGHYCSTCK